ncbi:MAG: ferritin [Chloroflexi bacterium]|nr:ferritin [Chloroflexota bacterium]
MADNRITDVLNESIARELQVIVQYMWQHIMAVGIESPELSDVFKKLSMAEMKHAEAFAERLDYLGGVPTTKPMPIDVGGTLEEMLQDDVRAEMDGINSYRHAIDLAFEVKDNATRTLYERILAEEEDHHYQLTTILEKKAPAHRVVQHEARETGAGRRAAA